MKKIYEWQYTMMKVMVELMIKQKIKKYKQKCDEHDAGFYKWWLHKMKLCTMKFLGSLHQIVPVEGGVGRIWEGKCLGG